MTSPLRLLKIGLPAEDVCALYGLTPEELDLLAEEAEGRQRQEPETPIAAGRKLMQNKMMTVLLRREELPGYRFRQTRKQAQ